MRRTLGVNELIAKTSLEPSQTSMIKRFCRNPPLTKLLSFLLCEVTHKPFIGKKTLTE